MYFLYLAISLIVAYLAGSVNFAILVARWAGGIDIRKAGNLNPGTANVGRVLGKVWAVPVLAGDLVKGLIPLILAKTLFFPVESYGDYFALFLTGMAAITGHCWPVFHGFRGGGGLATSIGVFMFFIPVEFFAALLIGFLAVRLLFSKKKYAIGQLVPMFFIPLAPVLVILSNLLPEVKLAGNLSLGGHPWYVVTGVAALSAWIFIINIRIVRGRFSKGHSGPKS